MSFLHTFPHEVKFPNFWLKEGKQLKTIKYQIWLKNHSLQLGATLIVKIGEVWLCGEIGKGV